MSLGHDDDTGQNKASAKAKADIVDKIMDFLADPVSYIAAGVGKAFASICEKGGGATQMFTQVLDKSLVADGSPLYRVVEALRGLNLPFTNPVIRKPEVGQWLLSRWSELFRVIRGYAQDLQAWLYSIVARVYQFAVDHTLLGTQWGGNLRRAYDLFRVEQYWGEST